MKKINLVVDGKPYLIVTKDGKTELGIKGSTTPEKDKESHDIDIPNILIITRGNADVLFVLRCGDKDSFKIMTAQDLYKLKYQWFEPFADNYRELIFINTEEYIIDAYKVYSWEDIAKFALVDRALLSYRTEGSGDWKNVCDGGDKFLLSLIDNVPYWSDAVGQIPFAVGTYRTFHTIKATVETGMTWATGNPIDAILQNSDSTNEYDNFFVLRGALYANRKFTYVVVATGKTYPAAEVTESSVEVSAEVLGKSITKEELEEYGIWNK